MERRVDVGCRLSPRWGPRLRWPSGWRHRGTGADAHKRRAHHGGDDQRQAAVLRLGRLDAEQGRGVLRRRRHAGLPGAAQARRARVRPRAADAGAAEHGRGLVHARHRRVAGGARLDEQHVPLATARRSNFLDVVLERRTSCRPRRSPRRPSAAARRSRRSSGRRAQRRHQRPDRRLPQLPLRPRRGHELHLADRQRVVHALVRRAVRPPGRATPATRRSRRPRPRRRDRLDQRAALLLAREGDAPARPRLRHATSTASTPTCTTAATTARPSTTACSSAAPRAAPTRSPTSPRATRSPT